MGYTHYWTQTRDFSDAEMRDIIDKIEKIIAEAEGKPTDTAGGYHAEPVEIGCPMGENPGADLALDRIAFNGVGDLSHETFHFIATRELESWQSADQLGWSFCKTARKPYDVVVVACLTFLATDYGFEVNSDGDHEELQAGVDLCCKALGKDYAHPLTVAQLR